jgi:hypothetical protein
VAVDACCEVAYELGRVGARHDRAKVPGVELIVEGNGARAVACHEVAHMVG